MCSMDCTRQACQSRFKISKPSAPIQREQPQQDFDTGKRLVGCLRKINRPGFPARDPAPIPACPDAMPDAPCRTSTAARMWTPLSCDARFASVTRSCPRFLEAKRRKACRTALSPLGQKLQQNMPWHGSGRSCLTSPVVAQPASRKFQRVSWPARPSVALVHARLDARAGPGPGIGGTDGSVRNGRPSLPLLPEPGGRVAVSFNGLETMTLFMPCTNAPSTRAVPTRSNPPGSRASRPDQPRSVSSFWLMHRQIPSKAHREKLNLAPMVPGAVSASPAIHVIASTQAARSSLAPRRQHHAGGDQCRTGEVIGVKALAELAEAAALGASRRRRRPAADLSRALQHGGDPAQPPAHVQATGVVEDLLQGRPWSLANWPAGLDSRVFIPGQAPRCWDDTRHRGSAPPLPAGPGSPVGCEDRRPPSRSQAAWGRAEPPWSKAPAEYAVSTAAGAVA